MSLDFNPDRAVPEPKLAASVLVLREGSEGLEVFCVERHQRSGFLGGAIVFPGGKVDENDADEAWTETSTALPARAVTLASTAASTRALAVAACRECLEEAGLCPLLPAPSPSDLDSLRMEAATAGLRAALEGRGLRLDLQALVPFARWITPEAESRRYDTAFFLLRCPPGQTGKHDDHETTASFWRRPAQLLHQWSAGTVFLAPPTVRCLELLAVAQSFDQAVRIGEEQSLLTICPVFVPASDQGLPFLALPGDPAHPVRERRVAGPTRFVLREGRFVGEDP